MAAASEVGNTQTASALLTSLMDIPSDLAWDRARGRDWESEGGLTPAVR